VYGSHGVSPQGGRMTMGDLFRNVARVPPSAFLSVPPSLSVPLSLPPSPSLPLPSALPLPLSLPHSLPLPLSSATSPGCLPLPSPPSLPPFPPPPPSLLRAPEREEAPPHPAARGAGCGEGSRIPSRSHFQRQRGMFPDISLEISSIERRRIPYFQIQRRRGEGETASESESYPASL
jgi:hypothetical protein